ncbi:helix-turn-helix transcriptional regulator [Microbacterium kyungheense]|uniref:AraC-like DNA-binding protein n=1 Tax=Microbacterium kyungheense TaxID=1263636 RepID=A0A543EB03_9MICO|nr:AraC family transcriptional regulator [Microbacterium kyungheense]TQM18669.1 AraC-like DNA-binding protein [Microbacterium kyungheense]
MDPTGHARGHSRAVADDDALERLLAAVDVRIRRQRRFHLHDGQPVVLDPGAITYAYVLSGEVRTRLTVGAPGSVAAGDILLTSGRAQGTLTAHGPVSLLLAELDLVDEVAHLASLLPDAAVVYAFADQEPAAAAMLPYMGVDADDELITRGGDLAVCRMMAATVLISAIRAWAAGGCAPDGWPAAAGDPFLDRVIAAIHADPGREWTVDALAALGAMSRSVFAERFRVRFGRSPAGYVTSVRMRAAQELLSRGLGVSTVSRELGYASDEGFSRAFRRSVGTTPSAWRSTHQPVSA